jgi:hypothetical protein
LPLAGPPMKKQQPKLAKVRPCEVPGCPRLTMHPQCAEHRSVAKALLTRLMRKAAA